MLKFNDFVSEIIDPVESYSKFNMKDILGGKTFSWRSGSSCAYSGRTSSSDEENVTSYADSTEAHNDGCDTLSCIDQAYDCGDGFLLFG